MISAPAAAAIGANSGVPCGDTATATVIPDSFNCATRSLIKPWSTDFSEYNF